MNAIYIRGILGVIIFGAGAFLHAQPLQVVTASLPAASVGVPYKQELITSGGLCLGAGTASGSTTAGAPLAVTVNSPATTKHWFLQGTPATAGTFTFTANLVWTYNRTNPADQNCTDTASRSFTLVVQGSSNPPPPPPPGNTTLTVDRPSIAVAYKVPHFPPTADTVRVTSTAATAITVQSSTDTGGPWMDVTAQSATTPAALIISYNISGLAPGTYTGHVTVNPGSQTPLVIPVTLTVSTDTGVQLQAAPTALAFTSFVGGADPPGQSVKVTVTGSNVFYQAAVSAAPPNGKWLAVTPTATATPAPLTVAVTGKDLPAGVYHGTLKLSVQGNDSVTIAVTYTLQAAILKPVISAGGVVDAAGGGKAIAPGTWVSIFGTALSATSRPWKDADFVNGLLPTSLDGVSVTIDGKPAAVAFVSPTQVNVLVPDDATTGLVPVQLKNAVSTSDSVLALQQTAAPALFEIPSSSYAVATHLDYSLVAGPKLVQQGIPGTPAKPGETIVLWATGFGATQPAISATAPVPAPLAIANPADLHIRIGGLDAAVSYAGLVAPGLYQFNVVVPQVSDGDQPVVAELRGLLTQSNLLLTVQH